MPAKIIQITKAKAEQTKSQKEFNRLVQKIETLEKSIVEYREIMVKIQQRALTELEPLRKQYFEQRAQLVYRFDRAHDSSFFKKNEKKKLAYLIQDIAFELIDAAGMEEFKPIYDKYSNEGSFDSINEEANQEVAERMKDLFSVFGIDLGDDVDLKDPEKMQEKLHEKMAEQQGAFEEHKRQQEERRAKRPKTQKQIEREQKKELEARNITKAVRTIYMDLVKAFHPDRVTDEAEKDRKTEIMQRVTEAYEKNDVLSLLRLQLEFERIDQSHIESLAEEHLKYYNKILREQTKELEEEYDNLMGQAQMISGQPAYMISTPFGLEFGFDRQIKEFKKVIKSIKKDINDFQSDEVVRAFLKVFKIPKHNDIDGFDFLF
ncbi:hypothetical protein [Runella aurantiaca]|uniref:J domain-containing protein n=1 Tax=Runella aurantiaca TaxID=2282308 RepID=A0A369I9G2_9BACT|nr:hypothetical protein [Runella aurantiaca]RDB03804.1 hypothetical protein DVG78_22250 [Runella aurantiaca]